MNDQMKNLDDHIILTDQEKRKLESEKKQMDRRK
jgi:hypothetical protein